MKLNKNLLQDNVSGVFYRYLVPSMSATIMISANYFIDTLCIGRKLGESGLAALNLAWPITTVLYALGYLMGAGGGTRYSAYMAQGKKEEAKGVYTGGIVTVLTVGIVITALAVIFIDPLVSLLGGAGDIRQNVTDYVLGVVIFSISYIGECFYAVILRNDGSPKLSMTGTLLGCSTNIILDIVFIWVFEWGMLGAALATSLAVTLNMCFGMSCTLRKTSGLKLKFSAMRWAEIVRTVRVGLSAFLTEIDGGLVTFVYNTVLIRISAGNSTTFVAIYGIVVNVNTIVLAAINGISNAMQPLVSANYGAGLWKRTRSFFRIARKFAIIFSIVVVLFIEWQAELVVTFFLEPGDDFLIQAAQAVRIVSVSYVLASVNMLTISYFQARQQFISASFGSIMRTLILPIAFVIAGAALFGISGVWMASIVIEITTALLLLGMYKRSNMRLKESMNKEREYE